VTAGSDIGFGSSGADHFNLGLTPSGIGNSNTMTGFAGNDIFEDGGGFDFISYHREQTSGGTQNVIVNFSGSAITVGTETVQAKTARDAYGFTDTFIGSIEAASGTNLADTFVGDNGNNQFRPLGGNDTVDGGDGFDEWTAVGATSTHYPKQLSQDCTIGALGVVILRRDDP
jgi:Ca2+-binding RTX toxin-like protein